MISTHITLARVERSLGVGPDSDFERTGRSVPHALGQRSPLFLKVATGLA